MSDRATELQQEIHAQKRHTNVIQVALEGQVSIQAARVDQLNAELHRVLARTEAEEKRRIEAVQRREAERAQAAEQMFRMNSHLACVTTDTKAAHTSQPQIYSLVSKQNRQVNELRKQLREAERRKHDAQMRLTAQVKRQVQEVADLMRQLDEDARVKMEMEAREREYERDNRQERRRNMEGPARIKRIWHNGFDPQSHTVPPDQEYVVERSQEGW